MSHARERRVDRPSVDPEYCRNKKQDNKELLK